MSAADRLAQIRARVDAASEGPWRVLATERMDEGDGVSTERVWVHGPRHSITNAGLALVHAEDPVRRDAEFIAAARDDVPDLVAAVEAVLALHRPLNNLGSPPCTHCLQEEPDGEVGFVPWPCPTVRKINEHLTETKEDDRG